MQRQPTLYILCGLGFSGKTTLSTRIAEHTGAKIVSTDAVYLEPEHEAKLKSTEPGQRWESVRKITEERIKQLLKSHTSAIVDDCNPRYEHRERLRQLAMENGARACPICKHNK